MRQNPPLIVYELSSGQRFYLAGRSAHRLAWVYEYNDPDFSLKAISRRLYLEDNDELDHRFSPNVPPWLMLPEGL